MSATYEGVSRSSRHAGVGVTNLGFPAEHYNPAKHNPPRPTRPGSEDALQYPSLDHTGVRRPYWGLKE